MDRSQFEWYRVDEYQRLRQKSLRRFFSYQKIVTVSRQKKEDFYEEKSISRYYDNSDDYGNEAVQTLQKIHRHQPEVKHPQTAVRQKVIIPSVFLSLQSTVLLITAAKDSWKV